ncbi:MAG: NAD+ synthase [Alphaproteobacteria bacterium]|jgi:NAD+ synthase|nr:NAD+ synthase [Alphaproteobacteria bacterium]MBP9876969.1 NAD+ synthase [Alphaproteobacteria bacterium]
MLKISLNQVNPWVGNLEYNFERIKYFYLKAVSSSLDLAVFPECVVTGYPLEDLVLKNFFMDRVLDYVQQLLELSKGHDTALLVGSPYKIGRRTHNCALFIHQGELKYVIPKKALPNYGVFDEKRVFSPSHDTTLIEFKGYNIGALICEDMWVAEPTAALQKAGADFLIVLNGSPYDANKDESRKMQSNARIDEVHLPLLYVNLVGGQDSLIFDGTSFVMDESKKVIDQFQSFHEQYKVYHLSKQANRCVIEPQEQQLPSKNDHLSNLYQALVVGLRDYVEKNRFKGVILGMSGGIDSAISAAIAVDALGKERVFAVMMPSPYTSQESLDDAAKASAMLGIKYDIIPIEKVMQAYGELLHDQFQGKAADITEENIQSRARGMLLMAMSNKFGMMVLSTGNKSEMAVGYATLYGDMCGGYNAIKDVYKMEVFALSKWRNQNHLSTFMGPLGTVMPERIITKPPSAELKPGQKDQDSLPPYEDLDVILAGLIEDDLSVAEIASKGYAVDVVRKVARLLDRAEYKRRQAPPGPKVTRKALAHERRYPITNGFTDEM